MGGIAKRVDYDCSCPTKLCPNEDDCALQVRSIYPEASGATWYSNISCWAEFGGHISTNASEDRTCHFRGKMFRQAKIRAAIWQI